MTAPQTPRPLPVVASVIGIAPTRKAMRHVIAAEYATEARDGDLPALAVPLALFEDAAFREAVRHRANTSVTGWEYPELADYLAAIAAELRARAGGADA